MTKQLDQDEKDILNSFENGEWESIATPSLMEKYQKMASSKIKDKQQTILDLPHRHLAPPNIQ
jgi:hypothetical protein